jgi:hypothetical protein
MTGCQCEHPGWCERHGVRKSPHLHKLCQTRQDYYDAWEQGRGPGQHLPVEPQPPGLGDMVAAGLASVGITKERYQAARAAVGLKRPCGCLKRQKKLNELGKRIGIG